MQRAHGAEPTWSTAEEAALAALPLVPRNVAALRLTGRELLELKRGQEARLLAKQERLVHVHGATVMLARAIYLVRTSHAGMPIPRIALPLLLVSGRRTSELLNNKSTFVPTPRLATCVFSGALKKRGARTLRRLRFRYCATTLRLRTASPCCVRPRVASS